MASLGIFNLQEAIYSEFGWMISQIILNRVLSLVLLWLLVPYFLLKSQFESRVLGRTVADLGKNGFHLSKTN